MIYLLITLYITAVVIYTQVFKFALQAAKNHAAMTVIMEIISALFLLAFIPLFNWRLPTTWLPVVLLIIASIFYGLSDRINTTVQSGVEASTYSIIKQLATVLMFISSFVFFGEPFVVWKVIGAALIIGSNIIIFWKPHQKINKYFLMGVGSTILSAVALFFDVNISGQFNLPFYLIISFVVSAITVTIVCKVSPKKIITECRQNKRIWYMVLVGLASAGLMLTNLLAYQTERVSIVAPLLATTVLANVIVGYIVLKERDHLVKKIFAACLIIIGVIILSFV
ncbi:EamA family transporter [Candidatus Saccharibacteria bacterium]|nr:EamA family transporter [Candidatus Saccharibacteria bacterium]